MSAPEARTDGGLSRAPPALLGLMVGLVAGLLLGGLVAGVLGYRAAKKARQGWNLTAVVVAATDIPENAVLSLDMIAMRMVPEQFITSSVVRPDSAQYIVNQKVLVPIQAGDLMLWTHFETKKLPVVLVAAADLPAGAPISEKDMAEKEVPQDLLTPSFVLARDRPQVVGRSPAAPFRRGDPILWTHFRADTGR